MTSVRSLLAKFASHSGQAFGKIEWREVDLVENSVAVRPVGSMRGLGATARRALHLRLDLGSIHARGAVT